MCTRRITILRTFMADTKGLLSSSKLGEDGRVRFAERWDAIQPGDAKRNHVRHVLNAANAHFDDLMELWEEAHV